MIVNAIIVGVTRDRQGAWVMKLEIPESDGVKAAALATQTDTAFIVEFKPVEA